MERKNSCINIVGAIKSTILFTIKSIEFIFKSNTNAIILNKIKYDTKMHKLQLNNVAINSFDTFLIK